MRRALPTLSLVLALPLASASVSLAFDVVSVERSLHVDSTESLSAGWSPPPDPPFPLPTPDCVTASGTTALSDGYADAAAHPIDETVAVDPAALCTDWIVPPSSVLRATQASSVGASVASVVGTHELRPHYALDGDEYYFVELIEQASAESLFELVFSVDADTPYELLGSIEANDFGASGFELRVRLEGPGGQPIVDVSSPGSCSPPFGCPPVGIDAGGILAPGVYTLRVRSAGAADSAPGPFMGPDDISFGSYDLSFSTDGGAAALPAIPLAWPLALALGLAGAAAARRSDPDSPSQRR